MLEIILSEDQQEHFNRINNNIAPYHSSILDTSTTGSGKTIIASAFSRYRNIRRIIIICNGNIQGKHWNTHGVMYDLPIVLILTYDMLRGSSINNELNNAELLNHGLLYKNNEDEFFVSDLFRSYVEEGLLLVVDECHLVKNDCGKTKALKELSRYIAYRNMTQPLPLPQFKSFTLFTSMTPFDEPDHVINFAMLCGVIRTNFYEDRANQSRSLNELYSYCNFFDPERTNSIWGTYDVDSKNIQMIIYRLITEVFLRLMSSFVKNSDKNYLSKQTIFYAYFDVDTIGVNLMKKSLQMIRSPAKNNGSKSKKINLLFSNLQINPIQQNVNSEINLENTELISEFNRITCNSEPSIDNRSGVIHGMITSQTVKTYFCVLKFVRKIFTTVENSKIIIFLNYKESINIIMRELIEYNPVKITGDQGCTEDVRNDIISNFNEPNLNSRLLIIISQIGSDGIELDDKDGNFPRISLAFPDFYHSRFFQIPGRIHRRFTKSNSLHFLILINSEECSEESVFKSINNKSKVMEDTLKNFEIIPPTKYEKIINPDSYDINELLRNAGMTIPKNEKKEVNTSKVVKIIKTSMVKNF